MSRFDNIASPGSLAKGERARRRPKHLEAIRQLPCLVCLRRPVEAAHLRMGSLEHGKRSAGLGRKPDDRWTVPLCVEHHRSQHGRGERIWWERHRIDPIPVAIALFGASPRIEDMTAIVLKMGGIR